MSKYSFILRVKAIDGDLLDDKVVVDLPIFIDRNDIKECNEDLERVFKHMLGTVNEKLDAFSTYNSNQKNSAAQE